ncbi:MAG: hypothetical protein HYY55_03000 [Candidatus Niyogibacteria bacterium]|nr:MAG: hypothetical protein HYY55_03000 [Candidatus Niyogibacteria bacterium]
MPFKQIFEFLKKFDGLKSHSQIVEKDILEWCFKKNNLSGNDLEIKVRQPNIIISTKNMAVKTFIFTSQNSLLDELRKKFGNRAPQKILFK